MPGFSTVTGEPSIMFADNCSFDGTQRGGAMTTNGQLWIGSTSAPNVKVGTLTSPMGTVSIGYSSPNITLDVIGAEDLHVTPFIVSAAGITNGANYTTIQAAINAANTAGGGMVYVQPGTYTENLTFFDKVQLVSVEYINAPQTTIIGLHTPPTSGAIAIRGMVLQSATHIFSSAAAGTSTISILECTFNITSGYIFNLPNWSGTGFNINDCGELSTNNGVLNNSGGAAFFSNNCQIGAGTTQTFTANAAVRLDLTFLNCPVNISAGTIFANFALFGQTVTLSGTATGNIFLGDFFPASGPAITMTSNGNISIFQSTINSSNNPAISGTGTGTLTYSDVVFLGNGKISASLTLATVSWQPYSQAIASTNGTKVGTCAFNSAQFTVDSNGFVSSLNGGPVTKFAVDAFTGPGTNPVVPSAAGIVTITGGQVATGVVGTNVIQTDSLAANTYTIQIQRSTTAATSTVADNGVSHFNSAQFTVDGNGFVSAVGGIISWQQISASQTLVKNTGYFCISPGGALSLALPTTASSTIGDTIRVTLDGATSWSITEASGQQIRFGSQQTTVSSGSLVSNAAGDTIEMVYQASGKWNVISSIGTLTVN